MPKTEAPMAVPILAEVLKPVGYGGEGMLDAMLGVGSALLVEEAVVVAGRIDDDDGAVGCGRLEGIVG